MIEINIITLSPVTRAEQCPGKEPVKSPPPQTALGHGIYELTEQIDAMYARVEEQIELTEL